MAAAPGLSGCLVVPSVSACSRGTAAPFITGGVESRLMPLLLFTGENVHFAASYVCHAAFRKVATNCCGAGAGSCERGQEEEAEAAAAAIGRCASRAPQALGSLG